MSPPERFCLSMPFTAFQCRCRCVSLRFHAFPCLSVLIDLLLFSLPCSSLTAPAVVVAAPPKPLRRPVSPTAAAGALSSTRSRGNGRLGDEAVKRVGVEAGDEAVEWG